MTRSHRFPIAAPGSALYYSLQGCSERSKSCIIKIFELSRELDSVLYEVSDPGVARAKLAWWKSELEKTVSGSAVQHPLLRSLRACLPPRSSAWACVELWTAMVEGVETDLSCNRHSDWPSLERFLNQSGGSCTQLCAQILLEDCNVGLRQESLDFARRCGQLCLYVKLLNELASSLMQNRIYIPLTDLQQQRLPARVLLERQPSTELKAVILMQIERAEMMKQTVFNQGAALLTVAERQALVPLLARIRINMAVLHAIKKKPAQLLEGRFDLAPIRKLWLALRADKSLERSAN